MLESLGEHEGRPLFALDLPSSAALPGVLELPSRHFLCFLAADFTRLSDGAIIKLANSLMAAGASYFVCWGPGCERAHDLIDDLTLLVSPEAQEDSIIMTTWHADESLLDALFFLLCSAWPDRAYEDTSACIVAVSVGGGDVAAEIREALSDPETLIAKVAAS